MTKEEIDSLKIGDIIHEMKVIDPSRVHSIWAVVKNAIPHPTIPGERSISLKHTKESWIYCATAGVMSSPHWILKFSTKPKIIDLI